MHFSAQIKKIVEFAKGVVKDKHKVIDKQRTIAPIFKLTIAIATANSQSTCRWR